MANIAPRALKNLNMTFFNVFNSKYSIMPVQGFHNISQTLNDYVIVLDILYLIIVLDIYIL